MKWTHAVAATVLAFGLAACQKPKQVQPAPTTPTPTEETDGASTSGIGTDAGAAAAAGAMSDAQRFRDEVRRARSVQGLMAAVG